MDFKKRWVRNSLLTIVSALSLSIPEGSFPFEIVNSRYKYMNGVKYPFDAYEALDELSTHPLITLSSIRILLYGPLKDEAEQYKGYLAGGSIDEDIPFGRSFSHFLDPETKTGIVPLENALIRARTKFRSAIENYKEENKEQAYTDLGHVLHLIQDMHVPEHIFLIQHVAPKSPFESYAVDYYDSKLRNFISGGDFDTGQLLMYDSLEEYIQKSARFTYGIYKEKFGEAKIKELSEEQVNELLSALIPHAISTSTGMIRFFYSEVKKD